MDYSSILVLVCAVLQIFVKHAEAQPPADPCDPNPCLNGGTCVSSSDMNYFCLCPWGHSGDHCESASKPVNVTTPVCAAKADIVFILDSSGSIGTANYNKMLTFVKDVVNKFDIGPNKIQVGAEIFSDRTYIQFHLNKYAARGPLVTAIGQLPYKRGSTNTGEALKNAYSKMFQTSNGDRSGVPNIAIVITDGPSTNRAITLAEAKKLQAHGVQVFAVGVGSAVDRTELNAVATDPDNTHVLTVTDFSKLTHITAQLNSQACAAILTSSTPVPTTTTTTENPCRDHHCVKYDIPAICSDYPAWAMENCQISCHFCDYFPITTPAPTTTPLTPPPEEPPANPCGPNPCLNGGSCISSGVNYFCSCPLGHTGYHCESAITTPAPTTTPLTPPPEGTGP